MKILVLFTLLITYLFAYESVKIDTHGKSYENSSFENGHSNFSSQSFSMSALKDTNVSKKVQPQKKKLQK
jgi:hypothetical protein